MQKCPHCQYKTTKPKQMQRHLEKTGHGKTEKRRKWQGHKQVGGKKK